MAWHNARWVNLFLVDFAVIFMKIALSCFVAPTLQAYHGGPTSILLDNPKILQQQPLTNTSLVGVR